MILRNKNYQDIVYTNIDFNEIVLKLRAEWIKYLISTDKSIIEHCSNRYLKQLFNIFVESWSIDEISNIRSLRNYVIGLK